MRALKWKYSQPGPTRRLGVNRGVAWLDGKLFRGGGDADVFALDAATGKPAWDASIGDPANGDSVPMAPIAWNGMVFVGNAGGDNFGVTGRVYALSAADGREVWRFNVVPESGPARATWKIQAIAILPPGGATWTTYSLDPETGVLWISTGNVAPDFVVALHPGDNLYTTSVIALDAKTGAMLRYIQPVKKDFHDWDMTGPPALIKTKGGRLIAAAAGQDGLLYGIDRTGVAAGRKPSQTPLKILYATPVTTRGSAWAGSGDPQHSFGRSDPKEMWGGWLTAVDADSGRLRWRYKSPTPMLAAWFSPGI